MTFRNYHGSDRSSTARSAMTGGGMAIKRLARETGSQEPPIFTISATEGETASATISGTHPNWHIELVLPRGQDGTDGIDGTNGYCECNCECCNGGGGEEPPPCEDPYLHAGEEGWTYDGCNWSYTEPPV